MKGFWEKKARQALTAQRQNRTLPLGDPEDLSPPRSLPAGDGVVLDAHPLLRQHFGKRLSETAPEAWREGHRRLYQHLKASVPHWPEGLGGLQPLYHAMAHGCKAEVHQQACIGVYLDRILRGTGHDGFYSTNKLGAFGADLGAVACFFEDPGSGSPLG